MKFEQLLEKVGSFHRFQKQLYVLLFLGAIPSSIVTLHFGINHHVPQFRCSLPKKVELALQNTSYDDTMLEMFIPMEENKFAQCKMYDIDEEEMINLAYFNSSLGQIKRNTTTCTAGYHYHLAPGQMSVISQFDLVCDDSWKAPLAVSIFFLGMGFGTFSGSFADRFGRRPVYLGASFFLVLTSALAGFSWNFISYVVIMFFCGYFSLFNYIIGFVIGAELTGVKQRNFMVLGSFYSFAAGYLVNALLGYVFQNWRTFFFATTVCGLIYVPFYWLLPESARWLMTKGKHSEAMKSLEKIAKVNKKEDDIDTLLKQEHDGEKMSMDDSGSPSDGILTLIRSGIKGRCITAYFCWFAASTIYFAITINSASFSSDRFLNSLFGGLAELPSLLLGYFLITWIGRPRAVFLLLLVCGISCMTVPYLPEEQVHIVTSVAIVGKGAVSAVFYVVYVLTAEVTPTLIRTTSMGIASACARLGGILAPFLMYIGNVYNAIPFIILGLLGIVSGVATMMFIPETKNVVMPDSVLDAANNTRFYRWKLFKKFSPASAVVLPPRTNGASVQVAMKTI